VRLDALLMFLRLIAQTRSDAEPFDAGNSGIAGLPTSV
jgi:hypothetical protein